MPKELTQYEKDNGYKLFQKATPGEARLEHPAGHVQIIPYGVYVAVHPHFHADAYASGCVSSEMFDKSSPFLKGGGSGSEQTLTPEARKEKIIDALGVMADSGDPSQFTGAGVPKTDVLSQLVGFNVSAAERDAIWQEVIATKE